MKQAIDICGPFISTLLHLAPDGSTRSAGHLLALSGATHQQVGRTRRCAVALIFNDHQIGYLS